MNRVVIIWGNEYARRAIVLVVLYVLTNALSTPLSNFDYIIVYYLLLVLPDIRSESFLGYSFLFGLAYDLHYPIFLGVGVLLFMGLNFIKLQIYQMINMTKVYAYTLFKMGLLLVYTMLSVLFLGYTGLGYWQVVLHYFFFNLAVFLMLAAIIGGVRAFRHA